MKNYLLYNPLSSNGTVDADLDKLASSENDIRVDITTITDYGEFLASLEPDDRITLCGGDGTVNVFAQNILGLELKNEVYLYPIGTGNDFARDLGKERCATPDFPITQYIKNLPTVTVNGEERVFINGVGYGIDGYCCEMGDKQKKESDKPVNYTAIAIKGLLFDYKPTTATVTVDGKSFTYKNVWICPTMNGRYYGGGMLCAPEQTRDGKQLSLVLMHKGGKLRTLCVFPSIFKGKHIDHKKTVAMHIGKDILVEFDSPRPLQIDGETYLNVSSYHAKVNG